MISSHSAIREAKPDPALYYSEVIPLSVNDSRSPWYVWSGLPDKTFLSSPAAVSIEQIRRTNSTTIIVIAVAAGICVLFVLKSLDQGQRLNRSLVVARDLAIHSEVEAQKSAIELKSLNDGISNLNSQLMQKAEQLRAAQEDIVRKAKMAQLGTLIATVAHELRNPLGVIRTTSFALQRQLTGSGLDVRAKIARIESGIDRCDSIISQLLDFSRSSSANTAPVKLDDWLAASLNEEATKLPENVTVTCRLSLRELKVRIDPGQMQRVIINLLSNAVEAMNPKGQPEPTMQGRLPRIDVSTRMATRGVEIIFADNGPGIPDNILQKIREPLFTTKSFGTGLGLPAVEKIMDQHSGGLEVSSIWGEGATFVVWLPVTSVEQQAA